MTAEQEKNLRQMFQTESDCYADTWDTEDSIPIQGPDVQAMTEDKFIEVLKKYNLS